MPRRFWFALSVLMVAAGGAMLWTRPAPLVTEADVPAHAAFVSYAGLEETRRGHVSPPQLIETPEDGRVVLEVGGARLEVLAASSILLQHVVPLRLHVRSGAAMLHTSDRAIMLVLNGVSLRVDSGTTLDIDAATRSVTRNSTNVGGRMLQDGHPVQVVRWAEESPTDENDGSVRP